MGGPSRRRLAAASGAGPARSLLAGPWFGRFVG